MQLKALCNQVGSFYPRRENFRLTPEVKAKFTEKLRFDPREFCGRGVSEVVRTDGLKLVFEGQIMGVLPAFGDRAGGASVLRSAE